MSDQKATSPTISGLLKEGASQLRQQFGTIRASIPHAATKGTAVERVLRDFLNQRMPKRFRAGQGFVIDNENNLSRQTDIIIHDTFSGLVYTTSEEADIVPVDTVPAVIEVKSVLNKNELRDGYEKIASCKSLLKSPESELDHKSTGSQLTTIGTLGVVFGFESTTNLQTLGKAMEDLNQEFDSWLWPDMVVVLDKGVLEYSVEYPGAREAAGSLNPPCDRKFVIPPVFVRLTLYDSGEFTLNHFFYRLMSHVVFYPMRPALLPAAAREGLPSQVMILDSYQYDLSRQLKRTPPEWFSENQPTPTVLFNVELEGKPFGLLEYYRWNDGAVVGGQGRCDLRQLLSFVLPSSAGQVMGPPEMPRQMTTLLRVTEDEFRRWKLTLEEKTNLTFTEVDPKLFYEEHRDKQEASAVREQIEGDDAA